jgi:hypothetical protein
MTAGRRLRSSNETGVHEIADDRSPPVAAAAAADPLGAAGFATLGEAGVFAAVRASISARPLMEQRAGSASAIAKIAAIAPQRIPAATAGTVPRRQRISRRRAGERRLGRANRGVRRKSARLARGPAVPQKV